MKRKFLLLTLVFCLVLALTFTMVACDVLSNFAQYTDSDTGDDQNDTKQTDTDQSDSIEALSNKATAQLESMSQGNGYLIRYTVTSTDNDNGEIIAIGVKNNIYYASMDNVGYYYDLSNPSSITWYENRTGSWEKTTMYYTGEYTREDAVEGMKAVLGTYNVWVTYYDAFLGSIKNATKSSATILNRACTKYSFNGATLIDGSFNTAMASYSCYVDNSTSICLKWQYSYINDGKNESWSLECTQFDTNPDLTLPTVSGGADDNGGNNQNQGSDTTTVKQKTLATKESIISAIGSTYKITATNLSGEAPTTAASDGTYYYSSSPIVYFQKKAGDYYFTYADLRDGKFHKIATPNYYQEGSIATILGRGNVGNILQFDGEPIKYQTEESVVFLTRQATKYTYESDNDYGYDMYFHEEIIIDNETGACLKYTMEGRGHSSGYRNKTSFVVTEFEYGADNYEVETFLAAEKEKIDVYAWDIEFMNQAGIIDINAPEESELWTSYWDYSTTRDSDDANWEVQYHFACETGSERDQEINALIQSIYEAGANLTENGNNASFADLCSYDEDDGSYDFVGYTNDYQIYVEAKFISVASPSYWRFTLIISAK